MSITRTRRDRCPGALRPWPADDGLLVRLRLVGGRLPGSSLRSLVDVAEEYGDGRVHVTGRANLQVRALPDDGGTLPDVVLGAIEATGLLPSRTHELVRNLVVSPATGIAGGRGDLRPTAAALDRELCADPALSALPGRFLFVLDDGRGDVLDRDCDLGLVVLDQGAVQLRVGTGWGSVVPRGEAVAEVLALAHRFLEARGTGPGAAWHVEELARPLEDATAADRRLPHPTPPLAFGAVPGGHHVQVPEGGLDRRASEALLATAGDEVVVTPWRGILVPERGGSR
jgi:precorrin-3B synthase